MSDDAETTRWHAELEPALTALQQMVDNPANLQTSAIVLTFADPTGQSGLDCLTVPQGLSPAREREAQLAMLGAAIRRLQDFEASLRPITIGQA